MRKHAPPTLSPFLKTSSVLINQVSARASALVAQLQASQSTTVQLQSENQRIKSEIYGVIHEITDAFIPNEGLPSPEWCQILSSCVEAQILQSNYEVLWARHLKSPLMITADIYTEMARRHDNLRGSYRQALASYAALQDGLQNLSRQPTIPLNVSLLGPLRPSLT